MNIEYIRSLVRPVVTLAFIFGFIGMSIFQIDIPDSYMTMTGMVMIFWFKSRDEMKKP